MKILKWILLVTLISLAAFMPWIALDYHIQTTCTEQNKNYNEVGGKK